MTTSATFRIPCCAVELQKRGVATEQIEKLVWHNPQKFFGQSGQFKLKQRP